MQKYSEIAYRCTSDTTRILGATLDTLSEDDLLNELINFIRFGGRGWVYTINVASLMASRKNQQLKNFIDKSEYVVADGQPLVWLSKLTNNPIPMRLAGVDLVDSTVKLVHKKLTSRHVGLKVAGFNHGFFPQTESRQQAAKIESSGASILFVAMGYPRQETFISDNWAHLGVNLAIPVGGSFDVIAGKRIRAPQALQNAGMEWLFRLIQEPRRLLFRYVITNTKFIWCSIRGILAGDVGN